LIVISPQTQTGLNLTVPIPWGGEVVAQDNPFLTSLRFSNSHGPFLTRLVLSNLSSIVSISGPNLDSDLFGRQIILENLPNLAIIEMPKISRINGVSFRNLPKLKSLTLGGESLRSVHSEFEVINVGLDSIDAIFNIGGYADNVTIDGIPNVDSLEFAIEKSSNRVIINGNDKLNLRFQVVDPEVNMTFHDLTLSGVASLSRNYTPPPDNPNVKPVRRGLAKQQLLVDTFVAANNTFTSLPILFDNLARIYITNNTNLQSLMYNKKWSSFNISHIEITQNPKLVFSPTPEQLDNPAYINYTQTWTWPTGGDIDTLILEGNFDSDFLCVHSSQAQNI